MFKSPRAACLPVSHRADLKLRSQLFHVEMVGLMLTCMDIWICNKVGVGKLGIFFLGFGGTVRFFPILLCCPTFVIQKKKM
jgi:hypothetical protein